MGMAGFFRRAKAGRFGTHTVYVASEKIGALTSASTDTFRFPTPGKRVALISASVQAQTPPVITTGNSLATLKKFRASDGATVVLSAAVDLETLVANKTRAFTLLTAPSDADFTADPGVPGSNGDTYFVDVVNGTTVATQPVALFFVLELAVLE